MNEVYVIAGGEWLRNNLNAIAAFMGTRTWDSIEKIALTLSVLAVAVMWVQRHNVMDLLGWVAVFVLISLLRRGFGRYSGCLWHCISARCGL